MTRKVLAVRACNDAMSPTSSHDESETRAGLELQCNVGDGNLEAARGDARSEEVNCSAEELLAALSPPIFRVGQPPTVGPEPE
jgi:hypothetical protein